jgi:molybdopterin-guanine dinucleotide biosynthesis protein A
MGVIDKGLPQFLGTPLALRALQRRSSQVGRVVFSANRNLATYEAMAAPVWPDASKDTLIDAAVTTQDHWQDHW